MESRFGLIFLLFLGTYYVIAQETFQLRSLGERNKCITIAGYAQNDGGALVIWPCESGEHFAWYTVQSKADPEYFNLYYKHAYNKCASVTGASVANGATIVNWNCADSPNQQWKFIDSDICSSIRYLVSKQSGKCFSAYGDSLANGVAIVQWDCVQRFNQQFIVKEVGGSGQSVGTTTSSSI